MTKNLEGTARNVDLLLRSHTITRTELANYLVFTTSAVSQKLSGNCFTLRSEQDCGTHPFLECLSPALVLSFASGDGHKASLRITLDIYEMLTRLNNGYQPSIEEQEGFYLSLAVFKNILASVPYKEVLLTKTGHQFYEIRNEDSVLNMRVSEKGEPYHVD